MTKIILQDTFFIAVLVGLSIPIGIYIYKVMTGQKVFLTKILSPVENCVYKIIGNWNVEGMGAKQYLVSVMTFSTIGLVFLWGLLMIQGFLPLNPEGMKGTSWHLAFNTAASFVSNTNWQAYSGESTLSYLTQVYWTDSSKFCFSGNRYRCSIRTDSRFHSQKRTKDR